MFRNFLLPVVISWSLAAFAQAPAAKPAASAPPQIATQGLLADGTPVRLRLENVNGSVRVGDTLELVVVEEVRVRDVVVIPRGSVAAAIVSSPQSKTSDGHDGKIDVNFLNVALSDGKRVSLRESQTARSRTTVVASSSGQDVAIASGIDVTAFIDGDSTLDLVKLQAANRTSSEVKITSNPTKSEISIDGRQVGNTPYVLHLALGDHVVMLRQSGYRPWQRNLRVTADPVNLDATLVKEDGLESVPQAKPAAVSLGEAARAARARKATQPSDGATPSGQSVPQN
jgi:PEGA domain